jgi:hypothetical protein
VALFFLSTTENVTVPALFKKTELPAGFTTIDDTSPPKAPKDPLKELNRAVPFSVSVEYLRASVIF